MKMKTYTELGFEPGSLKYTKLRLCPARIPRPLLLPAPWP